MLKNQLKTSLRNLIKNTSHTAINILGLALGIATSCLITIYVVNELSYDATHPDVDLFNRVNMTNIWLPDGEGMSSSVLPLAVVLTHDYPEVETALRINMPVQHIVRRGKDKAFYGNSHVHSLFRVVWAGFLYGWLSIEYC